MNHVFKLLVFTFVLLDLISADCSSKKVSIVTDLDGDIADKSYTINATGFLWHVAVFQQDQDDEGMVFLCSGTIVQARFVLTAASCVVQAAPSQLRVVANLSLLHSPVHTADDAQLVYNVSGKYYPYHSNGSTLEEDLAVLKLQDNVTYTTPQLTALPPTERLSKHCFTLGWGVHDYDHVEKSEGSCHKSSAQKSLTVLLNQPQQSSYTLSSIFDIRRSFSMSRSFMHKVFNIFSTDEQLGNIKDLTCPLNEYTHFKMVKVSAKGKRDWAFCSDSSHLCLSGWNSTNLAKQVDIGSPIFCKVKTPRFGKNRKAELPTVSQFGLAGVITSKHTELVPLLKLNTSISVMKADNITHYAHFIFSVLKQNVQQGSFVCL